VPLQLEDHGTTLMPHTRILCRFLLKMYLISKALKTRAATPKTAIAAIGQAIRRRALTRKGEDAGLTAVGR